MPIPHARKLITALGLAERGLKPVVLERERIGHGASGRNGGFVLAGYAAETSAIIKKVGLAQARELFGLTRDAQKLIRSRIEKYNIDCNPVDGYLHMSWFDDAANTERDADYMRETFDLPVEFWPREKVREACVTDRYYDAQLYSDYFHMHPLNYLLGIARAAEDTGARIFEESMAVRVEETTNGFIVHTKDGSVHAHHIVYCGSAYFNGMEKRLQRSCLPVSTYVMTTEPLPQEKLESAIRVPYALRDTRWTDDYYRVLPDRSILWGGRCGLGRSVPQGLPDEMLHDLLKIYPQLEGTKVRTAWAGVMGYSVHKMPHIAQLQPGVWVCTNFGGNGVGPTTAGGEVVAAAIADSDETYKLFSPWGFAWTGGVLGPLVARSVYCAWGVGDTLRGIGK